MRLTSTKVVPAEHAATGAIIVLWVLAAVLVLASWFGSYIAIAIGPQAALAGPVAWPAWKGEAMALAVGFQFAVSVVQWGMRALFRRTKVGAFMFVYVVALLISGVPSFLTYWGWAGADLTAQLGGEIVGGLVLAVAVLAGDWLPEQMLLK
jgi:hypothetical protein